MGRRTVIAPGGMKLLQVEMFDAIPGEAGRVVFVHPRVDRNHQQRQLAAVGL